MDGGPMSFMQRGWHIPFARRRAMGQAVRMIIHRLTPFISMPIIRYMKALS
jgi:hypothetical protein